MLYDIKFGCSYAHVGTCVTLTHIHNCTHIQIHALVDHCLATQVFIPSLCFILMSMVNCKANIEFQLSHFYCLYEHELAKRVQIIEVGL